MSLPIVRLAARLEQSDEFHLARLLILLQAAEGKKKSAASRAVAGIMKLAKLDFLVRYPNCLERVLERLEIRSEAADVQPHERGSIEASMIRFRYGPWDERYRRWIGLLVGKGLAETFLVGRTVNVGLSDRGRELASKLASLEEFVAISERSKLTVKAVGSLPATRLKEFIYETFPEIISMEWGEPINL